MNWVKAVSAVACMLLMVAGARAAELREITVEQANVDDQGHSPIPIAIWAPATGDRLSLVVISHGTGGGMASHLDTAQALAEAGFVVVAPTHWGDNFQDDSIVGASAWFVDRSRHISSVIDYMVGHPTIIDPMSPPFDQEAASTRCESTPNRSTTSIVAVS